MATLVERPRPASHHIVSFDGIRGLAVLMVLIGHAGWFNNGWVGVDLFFVLSGFLITGILRRSREDPFYWRRFYIKRACRILPPIVLGIAATALLWPHPSAIGLAGYLLSFGNIVDITRFDIKPLEHLWSLSVEEHFYVFWPFAVLLLSRRRLQFLLVPTIVVAVLLRLGFTQPGNVEADNVIYYLTPFRIEGIALGSLLSLLLEETSWQELLAKWSGYGAALAATIYLVLWTLLGHKHFFPFAHSRIFNSIGYSLVTVTAFFVVAYARLRPTALPTRLLRNRLLVGLGVISYGAYVYSWITLQILRNDFPALAGSLGGFIHILVSVALAAFLFRYYEKPITAWGKRRAAQLGRPTRTRGPETAVVEIPLNSREEPA
jgi:peptidoglycan/LPS O-acetylase OafA/YrhL